jgi:hypothetical protein
MNALALLFLSLGSVAEAQPARREEPSSLGLRVEPEEGAPHRYRMTLVLADGTAEADVVMDRRLLSFQFTPEGSRRARTCRHPEAPRRVSEARVVHLDATTRSLSEWIDLRMYCFRDRAELARGGTLRATYGFSRRGRDRYVVRGETARSIDGPSLTLASAPVADVPAPEVVVRLADRDARSSAGITFAVSVAPAQSARIYLRDDLFRFTVNGPIGTVECVVERAAIVPIVDFYRRVGPRRPARTTIEARRWCPRDTFAVEGIYEIVPHVDLVYDGSRYDFEALTGTFDGAPALLRVRRSDRGYFEQREGVL